MEEDVREHCAEEDEHAWEAEVQIPLDADELLDELDLTAFDLLSGVCDEENEESGVEESLTWKPLSYDASEVKKRSCDSNDENDEQNKSKLMESAVHIGSNGRIHQEIARNSAGNKEVILTDDEDTENEVSPSQNNDVSNAQHRNSSAIQQTVPDLSFLEKANSSFANISGTMNASLSPPPPNESEKISSDLVLDSKTIKSPKNNRKGDLLNRRGRKKLSPLRMPENASLPSEDVAYVQKMQETKEWKGSEEKPENDLVKVIKDGQCS